ARSARNISGIASKIAATRWLRLSLDSTASRSVSDIASRREMSSGPGSSRSCSGVAVARSVGIGSLLLGTGGLSVPGAQDPGVVSADRLLPTVNYPPVGPSASRMRPASRALGDDTLLLEEP